jgi:predicted DNA-binding protein
MQKADTTMTIRLNQDTATRLAELAARLPGCTRSGLVRALLGRALDAVGDDLALLVAPPAPVDEPRVRRL